MSYPYRPILSIGPRGPEGPQGSPGPPGDTGPQGPPGETDVNATNVDAAGAVMNADTTTAEMAFVVDEDNLGSDLDTKIPTQQSVKSYADGVGIAQESLLDTHNATTTSVHGITDTSKVVVSDDYTSLVQITQAAYDLLSPPDPNTLYVIVG